MTTSSRQLAAIMFTDIVGFTAMMGKDEFSATEVLNQNRDIQFRVIEFFQGKVIKEMGDGILAIFSSSVSAVKCALEIAKKLKEQTDWEIRIGIHLGDVSFTKSDVFGDGVNIASRIQELAPHSSIYISESIRKTIRNQAGIGMVLVGEKRLKNVDEKIRIYKLYEKKENDRGFEEPKRYSKPLLKRLTVILILILAVLWWWKSEFFKQEHLLGESRIAVLPFENKTNNRDLDIFGSMVADWITQGLITSVSVKVVMPESIQDNIRLLSEPNLNSFVSRVGADKILRGSYYLNGSTISVQTQLIDVRTGEIEVPISIVKGEAENPESLASEVQQKLLTAFLPEDIHQRLVLTNPPKIGAFDYFKNGQSIFACDYQEARRLFALAIKEDSTFVMPYLVSAVTYSNMGNLLAADSVFQLVLTKSLQKTRYESLMIEYVRSVISRDYTEAYKNILAIFNIDPKSFLINYQTGLFAAWLNKPQLAVEHFANLDPQEIDHDEICTSAWWNSAYAKQLIRLSRFEEAIDVLKAIPPERFTIDHYELEVMARIMMSEKIVVSQEKLDQLTNEDSRIASTYRLVSRIHTLAGKPELARQASIKSLEFQMHPYALVQLKDYAGVLKLYSKNSPSGPMNLAYETVALWNTGKKDHAQKIIDELEVELDSRDARTGKGIRQYALAVIYSSIGNYELAMDMIHGSLANNIAPNTDRYEFDPLLEPLWAHPSWIRIMPQKR